MIPVIYLCPFYNLKLVSEIFLKPCKNVKHHKMTCRTQQPLVWLNYCLSYGSLNIENNSFLDILVKFTLIWNTIRGSTENENCKSGLHTFLSYGPLNIENSHLSHIFLSTLVRERQMHLLFEFSFDRVLALAWCKCSGGALCSACSTFISYCLTKNRILHIMQIVYLGDVIDISCK